MVHCDHVSILLSYGDMAPPMLDGRTHSRTDAQVILYPVQCNALHWTDKKAHLLFRKPSISFVLSFHYYNATLTEEYTRLAFSENA